jgi:hypothetical protein
LEIEIACSQWEGAASTQGPQPFNLGLGGRRGEVFFFLFGVSDVFLPCSQVVSKFSMCSLRVFPITPDFKPICFAQNPPLFTDINGVFFGRGITPDEKL